MLFVRCPFHLAICKRGMHAECLIIFAFISSVRKNDEKNEEKDSAIQKKHG